MGGRHHKPPSRTTHSPDSQKLDQNHPLVILQRLKGIMLTCFVVPIYMWWMFRFTKVFTEDQSFWQRLGYFLSLMGISFPENILLLANHIVIPVVLIAILYMGPILMMFLSNELPFQQTFDWTTHLLYLKGLIGMRNLVVGPVSEEFIFRGCMVAVVAFSGASTSKLIFALPLVFGIAHIHHGYETYRKQGSTRRALLNAIIMSLSQFAYTTLYGWFTTFLFLRTSNLISPCLCHVFCNVMGAPDVTNIQYFGRMKNWLYLSFVTGIILFFILLKPLTSPQLYGSEDGSIYWSFTMGVSSNGANT
ncbi:hypothetical protein BGZ76_001670 [Entomortierella beljakovae]|nr:hypothetical protein BGZ76_001670 [Entomortierella beljakovae]